MLRRAFIGLAALALSGCLQESPLSDVHLTDPKVIRPTFVIRKEKEGSTTRYQFEAQLDDKNGSGIEILDGAVYLNGIRMSVKHTYLGDIPYYTLGVSKIKFKLDSLYTFRVVLSDGSEYSSSVRTQSQDLTAASTKISNGYAHISWTGDHAGPIRLDYTLKRDTLSTTRSLEYVPNGTNDTIRVPMEGYSKIAYTLTTVRQGTVNPAFRSGGSITSTVAVKK